MTSPRVLLAVLSQRTSAKGRPYLSGWLGKARVVAFAGEPDARGDPTWERSTSPSLSRAKARRGQPQSIRAIRGQDGEIEPRSAGAPSGFPGRPRRRESEADAAGPVMVSVQARTRQLRGKFGRRAQKLAGQLVDPKINLPAFRDLVAGLQARAKEMAGVSCPVPTIDDPVVLERLMGALELAFKELVGAAHTPTS
jgi:hypothetical protein